MQSVLEGLQVNTIVMNVVLPWEGKGKELLLRSNKLPRDGVGLELTDGNTVADDVAVTDPDTVHRVTDGVLIREARGVNEIEPDGEDVRRPRRR